jgi:hypothetical protein
MTVAVVVVLATLVAAPVRAETLTVGVFAPAAPFEGAAARLELATKLAGVLGKAVGADGVGRVYGRAGDFAAAVKKGEVQVAVVDATYLAAAGGGTVIAASVRGGDGSRAWQIVARGGAKGVLALQGKKLLVPSVGGREADFVLNALFGGELGKGFFASIASSPDTASTLAALGLGKADAAVVPAEADLPTGVSRVASLPAIPGPVLVVYGTTTADRRSALASAAAGWKGDAAIGGFKLADGDAVRALARRYTSQPRRGPMAVPSVRIVVGELVADRTLAITALDPKQRIAVIAPPK